MFSAEEASCPVAMIVVAASNWDPGRKICEGGIERAMLAVESFELLMPRIEFTSAEARMDPGGNRARVAALILLA